MSARIALPTLGVVVLAAVLLHRPVAAGAWGLPHGQWYANLEGSDYTSDTFHSTSARLDTGLVVEQRALVSTVEVGWKKHTTMVFRLPALSVSRRTSQVAGTATGFQDVGVGLRYSFASAVRAAALEFDWRGPAGYNSKLDSLGIQLGEGLQQLSLQLQAGTAIQKGGFVEGSVGYGHRYLGIAERASGPYVPGDPHTAKYRWSDQLQLSADVAWWLGQSWLVSGRYRGGLTLSHGALVEDEDVHLLGPALHFRVDERLDMFAGSWSTITGKNTLHFDQFYLGLAFHRNKLNRLQGYLGGTSAP